MTIVGKVVCIATLSFNPLILLNKLFVRSKIRLNYVQCVLLFMILYICKIYLKHFGFH